MVKKILIENIKIDRDLEPGDDLSDLGPESLKDPVVVQGDVLIDGLRRITLATKLGHTEIRAVDPQNLEEASEALARNHRFHTPSWRRILQMHPYLTELTAQRLRRIRSEQSTGLKKFQRWNPDRVRVERSRDLITKAYGGIKAHQWERLVTLVGTDRRDLLEKVYNNELSPAAAYVRVKDRKNPFRGSVTNAKEQHEILVASVQAMGATISAIYRIARPIKITKRQAEPILASLIKIRGTLSTIIHQLEEAVGK